MKNLAFILAGISSLASAQYISSPATHEIKIYNQGLASLDKRLDMIASAKRSIDVEYFIYDDTDISSRLVSQALAAKAQQFQIDERGRRLNNDVLTNKTPFFTCRIIFV